jgi:hypothetical protein
MHVFLDLLKTIMAGTETHKIRILKIIMSLVWNEKGREEQKIIHYSLTTLKSFHYITKDLTVRLFPVRTYLSEMKSKAVNQMKSSRHSYHFPSQMIPQTSLKYSKAGGQGSATEAVPLLLNSLMSLLSRSCLYIISKPWVWKT